MVSIYDVCIAVQFVYDKVRGQSKKPIESHLTANA